MLYTDPKRIQQIDFTGILYREGNIKLLFILEEAKKKEFLIFHKEL